MNATTHPTPLPTIGQVHDGGIVAGFIREAGHLFAIIVAPKAEGERAEIAWGKYGEDIPGAKSYSNGAANTAAMAEAGSELAKWARGLTINGHSDWYIPARDELELCYRNLKPTTQENYTWRHGDNPSSEPPGYPYTDASPTQTAVESHQEGSADAFLPDWYWSSTQFSPHFAWLQGFGVGYQTSAHKGNSLRARVVRRSLIQ